MHDRIVFDIEDKETIFSMRSDHSWRGATLSVKNMTMARMTRTFFIISHFSYDHKDLQLFPSIRVLEVKNKKSQCPQGFKDHAVQLAQEFESPTKVGKQLESRALDMRTSGSDVRIYQKVALGFENSRSKSSSAVNWRRERDSNSRKGYPFTRFRGVLLQPLGHLSTR